MGESEWSLSPPHFRPYVTIAPTFAMDLDPPDGEVETDSEHPVLYLETFLLFFFLIAGILANAPVLILYLRSKHIRSITDK